MKSYLQIDTQKRTRTIKNIFPLQLNHHQLSQIGIPVTMIDGEITVVKVVVMGGDGIQGMEEIGIEGTTGMTSGTTEITVVMVEGGKTTGTEGLGTTDPNQNTSQVVTMKCTIDIDIASYLWNLKMF